MNNVEIGIFIKKLLSQNGMSNRDLISELEKRHISMSEANMSNFLNGKHGTNVENYLEISNILGITVDEILRAKLNDRKELDREKNFMDIVGTLSKKRMQFIQRTILVLTCITLLIVIYFSYFGRDNINFVSSNGVDFMSSRITKQDDWLYYCNPADNYSIYKMKANQKNKTKISNSSCMSISVEGDWIYFTKRIFLSPELENVSAYGRYSSGIYKVRLDGTEETKLLDGPEETDLSNGRLREIDFMRQIFRMQVSNNWIYYWGFNDDSLKYSINRMKTDGSSKETVVDAGMMFVVKDDWIYYIKGNVDLENLEEDDYENLISGDLEFEESPETSLYRVMIDGTNNTKIGGDNVEQFIVGDEWIYYVSDKIGLVTGIFSESYSYKKKSSIHKASLDGIEDIILVDNIHILESFNIKDDWIYYSDISSISKIKNDGSEKTLLVTHNIPFGGTVLIDDWIYFGEIYKIGPEGELPGKLFRIKINGKVKEEIN